MNKIHAFTQDCLSAHDAVALAGLLKSGKLSKKEVIEAAIARIEKVEPLLNALVLERFEKALEEGNHSTGYFANVPTLIKDNMPLSGYPTRHGSEAITSPITPQENDAYMKQFLNLGFTWLGKTRLSEFGLNATTEPPKGKPVRNPWNVEFSSGASSSGSAAMVASGAVPIAHGNDGGGSIRIPAANCGLVGLKPSRGRHIVSELVRALPVAVVSDGVLTRTVRDTAVFHAEMEKVYKNPKLAEIGLVNSPSKKRLKIGLQFDSINHYSSHSEVRELISNTAKLLENAGHEIVELPLPIDERFTQDFILYWSFLAFSIPTIGRKKVGNTLDINKLEPFTKDLNNNFKKHFLKFPGSLFRLRRIQRSYNKIFHHCDVVLTPVLAQPPAPLGYISPKVSFEELIERLKSYACFTPLANVAGAPALSIPAGLTDQGLPIGAHFFGKTGEEKTLLELAFEFEEIMPFPKINENLTSSSEKIAEEEFTFT